jgi:Cu-Zn family superoxide dismutase
MTRKTPLAVLSALMVAAAPVWAMAAQVSAPVALATATGPGAAVGTITFTDSPTGATIAADLHGLPPGQHGFHIHQNPDCGPTTPAPVAGAAPAAPVPAGAAGGHFDPDHTGMHMGPMAKGHMGDLPFITVAADGTDHETLTAPRWSDVSGLKGHALVIHAGGDNYADQPKPLGGGGARIACGVIQ